MNGVLVQRIRHCRVYSQRGVICCDDRTAGDVEPAIRKNFAASQWDARTVAVRMKAWNERFRQITRRVRAG